MAWMLRVRTRLECPEDNLRELTWDRNPNCRIARERKKRERTFPHSQNKGLSEKQRRAGRLQTSPSPHQRQRGRREIARDWRREASPTTLWEYSQLLTKSSWHPGWLTAARRVAAWDQLSSGDTRHYWDGCLRAHPGNPSAWTGEVFKIYDHLGQCARQAPGRLSCSDLGRAQNACPTKSVPLWSTREPEREQRPGKGRKRRAHCGQRPAQHSGAWAVSTGKAQLPRTGADPVWPMHGERSPHTPVTLQCPSLPTTQLTSEPKEVTPVSGWNLDTEETCKQRKPE